MRAVKTKLPKGKLSAQNWAKAILQPGKQYSKKTFIRIFAGSTLIALAVLLVSVLVLYNSFRDVVVEESYKKSIDLLKQSQSIFSSLHSWIIPSFFQIASEETVHRLIHADRLEKIEISAGLDRLDAIMPSFNLFQSMYIYNNRTGQYFSTINGFEDRECSDFALPNLLFNIDKYGVYRYIPRKMTYRISANVFREDSARLDTTNVLSVIVGNKPKAGRIINGALVINISEVKIRSSLLGTRIPPDSDLLILDSRGIVLTHPDPKMFAEDISSRGYIRKILAGGEEGTFIETIDGKQCLVAYITHPFWGWRFVNITPAEKIFASLNSLVERTIILLVVLMVGVLLVSFVSSLRIYLPLHRFFQASLDVREKFPAPVTEQESRRPSDLQYLDRTFREIVRKANAFEDYMDKTGELYKQEVLKAVFLGDIDADEIENHRDLVGRDIAGGPFYLAVIMLDNFAMLSELHSNDELGKLFRIIREMIFHYNPETKKIFIQMKKDHACVVYNLAGSGQGEKEWREGIRATFSALQTTVARELSCTCTIALGDLFREHGDLCAEYTRCVQLTRYRFRFGYNRIIEPGMCTTVSGGDYVFPEDKFAHLLSNLKLGKMTEMEQQIDEILDGVRDYEYEDFVHLADFIGYYAGQSLGKFRENLQMHYDVLKGYVQEIKSSETLDDLKRKLLEMFTLIHELFQKKKSHRTEDLAGKIRTYVDEHFKNPALSIDSLAASTGVSTCYVRVLFRKVFGISASDYINKLRLEYCKEKLRTTRNTVKKIFKEAGYYNYSYFFTLFKKDTGLTPNQYRVQKTSH